MAPRVHNSGHWSIEGGANISQFLAHINSVSGEPNNNVSIDYMPSVMFNILSGHLSNEKVEMLKRDYEIFLHDYHKTEKKIVN